MLACYLAILGVRGLVREGSHLVPLTMVVDMVSVVMEGAVIMNSFPMGAVPSTCWPEEESAEREREREPDTPAVSVT